MDQKKSPAIMVAEILAKAIQRLKTQNPPSIPQPRPAST
jgi:hypothetical protein